MVLSHTLNKGQHRDALTLEHTRGLYYNSESHNMVAGSSLIHTGKVIYASLISGAEKFHLHTSSAAWVGTLVG